MGIHLSDLWANVQKINAQVSHCGIVCNSKEMETTQMSISRGLLKYITELQYEIILGSPKEEWERILFIYMEKLYFTL